MADVELRRKVAENVKRLLGSALKLLIITVVLKLLGRIMGEVEFTFLFYTVKANMVLSMVQMAATIYYGFYILKSSIFFIDKISGLVTNALGLTESKLPRRIAMDIVYIIGLVLAWEALVPMVSEIPRFGGLTLTAIQVVIILLGAGIIYDAGKHVFKLLEDRINRIIDRLSDSISKLIIEG